MRIRVALEAPPALPQYGCMTHTAPEAQTQYPSSRWHIDFRMHVDTENPEGTYFTAEVSRKVPIAGGFTWASQGRYDWLPIEGAFPVQGMAWHAYMIERIDDLRAWLVQDMHHRETLGYADQIRHDVGVSVPKIPHQAG